MARDLLVVMKGEEETMPFVNTCEGEKKKDHGQLRN